MFFLRYRDYVIKRVLFLIPIFLSVSLITWFIADMAGNPLAAYVGEEALLRMTPADLQELYFALGLDAPWYERFFNHRLMLSRIQDNFKCFEENTGF